MASESGSGGRASGPDDTDSRPISVSELLARSRAEGEASAAPTRESRNRRRVGREGAVSVSELTGEIPRVRVADEQTESGRSEQPGPSTTAGGQRPVQSGTFPRSAAPVPRRHADDRAFPERAPGAADSARTPTGATPPRQMPGMSSSGMPSFAQPATSDFRAADVADRDVRATAPSAPRSAEENENANAVTGIIPVVGDDSDGLVVVDSDDVDVVELAAPEAPTPETPTPETPTPARSTPDASSADDFEAYRAFSEIEEDEPAPRKGLFGLSKGLRKKKDRSARPAAARERRRRAVEAAAVTEADHTSTAPVEVEGAAPAAEPTAAENAAAEPTAAESTAEQSATTQESADQPSADQKTTDQATFDESPAEHTAVLGMMAAPVADAAIADDTTTNDDTATPADTTTPADTASTDDAAETATQASADSVESAETRDTTAAADDHPGETDAATPDTDATEEPSPLLAWLSIIGQSLAGLAIGVGLFWGFTELWKWNVYFALVLAVLVIFGIVTFAHLVRRTKDLTTTLLAMGVALIVTIGPLVLLAT